MDGMEGIIIGLSIGIPIGYVLRVIESLTEKKVRGFVARFQKGDR